MKEIILGGNKLANGLIVKKYPIYIYDGDLHEMPERTRVAFENQMYASAHVPTDTKSLMDLRGRLANAIKHSKDNKETVGRISDNLINGLYQKIDQFTCKSHAFYLLIEGVTNFSEEYAKKKMKLLYSHGLNEFITNDICEDVKKKYIPNYAEIIQAYTTAESLINES